MDNYQKLAGRDANKTVILFEKIYDFLLLTTVGIQIVMDLVKKGTGSNVVPVIIPIVAVQVSRF